MKYVFKSIFIVAASIILFSGTSIAAWCPPDYGCIITKNGKPYKYTGAGYPEVVSTFRIECDNTSRVFVQTWLKRHTTINTWAKAGSGSKGGTYSATVTIKNKCENTKYTVYRTHWRVVFNYGAFSTGIFYSPQTGMNCGQA